MSLTTTSPLPKDLEKRLVDRFKRDHGMDKQIKKIEKKEKSAVKDTKKLLVMDKKKDKEQAKDKKMAAKCDMKMKAKKKK